MTGTLTRTAISVGTCLVTLALWWRHRSVLLPHILGILTDPGSLRPRMNRDRIDAFYTWQMPPGAPLRRRLRSSYELISRRDGGELWERRTRPRR